MSAHRLWSGGGRAEVRVDLALHKEQRVNPDYQELMMPGKHGAAAGDTGWWPSYRCRGKLARSEMGEQTEHGTGGTDAEARKGTGKDDENKERVMRDDQSRASGWTLSQLWSGDMETHLSLGPLTVQ